VLVSDNPGCLMHLRWWCGCEWEEDTGVASGAVDCGGVGGVRV